MRTVYLDSDFKCHITNDGTMAKYETDFFDGKCDIFVEGHRIKPEDETWIREDGTVFSGAEMIAPWKPSSDLDAAQREYEQEKLADAENALAILLGGDVV